MKNNALKVIKNKLKHDVQQKKEKGKTSYEVRRMTPKVLLKVVRFIPIKKRNLLFFTHLAGICPSILSSRKFSRTGVNRRVKHAWSNFVLTA